MLSQSSLTAVQQLVMTLMRLKLNLSCQDLGYRFGTHKSTISGVFSHVIEVMYVKLKPLIIWPDRDTLLDTMPMDFCKHCPSCAVTIDCFDSCAVIIDCFEVFLERPSNLFA